MTTEELLRFYEQSCKDKESSTMTDPVIRPSHYTQGEIETIDYIRDKLTAEEFVGYCKGNILKYISRELHKNGTEDLKKAQVYLAWAIDRRDEE